MNTTFTLLVDTREPDWPGHPWRGFIPAAVEIERATLETGDFALKGCEDAAIVERKAIPDLLGCLGHGRERFERELARGRYAGRFIVVIEGTLADLLHEARGLHPNAILGSLAAWQRRFCPFFFAGNAALAAAFSLRFLTQPAHEARERVSRLSRLSQAQTAKTRTGAGGVRETERVLPGG